MLKGSLRKQPFDLVGDARRARIVAALRPLIEEQVRSRLAMECVAQDLQISVRTAYYYRRALEERGAFASSLEKATPGPKVGSSRYTAEVDHIVDEVIQTHGLTSQKLPITELLNLAWDECKKRDVPKSLWPEIKGLRAGQVVDCSAWSLAGEWARARHALLDLSDFLLHGAPTGSNGTLVSWFDHPDDQALPGFMGSRPGRGVLGRLPVQRSRTVATNKDSELSLSLGFARNSESSESNTGEHADSSDNIS